MRSNFGKRREDFLSEAFQRDLKNLLLLSDGARSALAGMAGKLFLASTKREKNDLLDELDANFPEERVSVAGPSDLVNFFFKLFVVDPATEPAAGDSPEDIAADLQEVGGVFPDDDKEAQTRFVDVLQRVKTAAQEVRKEVREKAYSEGVLPGWKGIGATVELRGVFNKTFEFGDDAGSYSPELTAVVPVASIRLRLKDAQPDIVAFQVDEDELGLLIEALRSVQVELNELKSRVEMK